MRLMATLPFAGNIRVAHPAPMSNADQRVREAQPSNYPNQMDKKMIQMPFQK